MKRDHIIITLISPGTLQVIHSTNSSLFCVLVDLDSCLVNCTAIWNTFASFAF